MKVVIVKYNSGNTCSVAFALQRLGIEAVITDNAEEIRNADKVILPGVGAAGTAMDALREKQLIPTITTLWQPVLGICLGMQLMCNWSEEGDTECLGIFDQQVIKFQAGYIKVPHMGWNNISKLRSSLFANVADDAYMFYVHSYYTPVSAYTIATTGYGLDYSAAIQKNNFYGVQFHPEKSATEGQTILQNFIFDL